MNRVGPAQRAGVDEGYPARQGLMMLSYWAGHPALVGRVERKVVGLDTPP